MTEKHAWDEGVFDEGESVTVREREKSGKKESAMVRGKMKRGRGSQR